MRRVSPPYASAASMVMRESTAGLEFESSADGDRLAGAARIGQRRDLIALDLVTDATVQRDVAADVVGAADVERIAVGTRQRSNLALVALAANRHAAGKLLEVV